MDMTKCATNVQNALLPHSARISVKSFFKTPSKSVLDDRFACQNFVVQQFQLQCPRMGYAQSTSVISKMLLKLCRNEVPQEKIIMELIKNCY
ncbi:unnamed protein product [Bursaphelenchus okinawaensis]|uniref:Uncharacterized protein n=1 Tax=Bursaphelenchus okinawaensis TaxID=465554 RepID=A0A811KBL5_9BILA|nr:unnamed protein product [Bursaphelenchus okinawaensis]CAG9099459.1 unnamed protein product [Bursaphelenchus okinawaensis]